MNPVTSRAGHHRIPGVLHPLAFALLAVFAAPLAFADEGPAALDGIVVKTTRPNLPANLPNTVESVTAEQIKETVNAVTTAEVLNYLPSVHVRERYIGDRNGILVMRVNSSVASAQTAVYADGMLLSNYLNNSFSTPPRWGMVSPNEVDRVDVVYGPFSALYPGNSAGGVVSITTHMPTRFEAHAAVDLFTQDFKLYGTNAKFNGSHGSFSLGSRSGDWSYSVGIDHLDSYGQPQTFGAATRVTGLPANTPFTAVTGGFRDIDTSGNPRINTSSIGADHTVQDIAKVKVAYDLTPTLRAAYQVGVWQNVTDTSVASYVQDLTGRAVFNTTSAGATKYVKFAGDSNFYTLSGTQPGHSESEHMLHGLSLKESGNAELNWELQATLFDQNTDLTRAASKVTSLYESGTGSAGALPGGTATDANGTGWYTFDARAVWRPAADWGRQHEISFGAHDDRYTLKSVVLAVPNWLNSPAQAPLDAGTTLSNNSYGKTETRALYVQDAWHFRPDWTAVAGLRAEQWRAFDGSNYNVANAAAYQQLNYAGRNSTDVSPKLAFTWVASPEWTYRLSNGMATRYPTVAEIFQVISLANNVKANDPNLKPEKVTSGELSAERTFGKGVSRSSLFWEFKRDALISQSDVTVVPNISSIQNVDRVRTYGFEQVLNFQDVLLNGLDLNGSFTWTRSTITNDSRNPGLEGTDQPRIPKWRATVVADYHLNERLSTSVSFRYSGHQHNALFNTITRQYNDVNPDVYGAVSQYSVVDAKLLYRVTPQFSAAFGINNLGNNRYYVNPNPYPQRTFVGSLKYDY